MKVICVFQVVLNNLPKQLKLDLFLFFRPKRIMSYTGPMKRITGSFANYALYTFKFTFKLQDEKLAWNQIKNH